MLYVIIIIVILVLFNMTRDSIKGKNYWEKCEKEYYDLLNQGYDNKTALFKISKQSHPYLSDFVHEQIIEKFDNIDRLVLFIFNAGGGGDLDFRPKNNPKDDNRLTDQVALSILKNTSISEKGVVSTDMNAVWEEVK